MLYLAYLKDFLMLSSILSLLLIGMVIALKSGVVSVSGSHCRLVLGNLSSLIFTLAGCALFFLMIQQAIGFRLGAGW